MSYPRDAVLNIYDLLVRKDCQFRRVEIPFNQTSEEYAKEIIKMNISELTEITNGLECSKCYKKSAFKSLVQLRSSDEAADTYLRCTNPQCRAVKKL